MAYVCQQVKEEMKDEGDENSLQNKAWTVWFYIYYFLELEWERYTPFYSPIFIATLVHLFVSTLELYDVCVVEPNNINYEDDLLVCKKRDSVNNECLKTEPITDRDIKRLEVYNFTIYSLYCLAVMLPVAIPIVYLAHLMKDKDKKLKFDERILGATQFITVGATLFVCLMPFLLAVHSEIVSKTVFGKQEVFSAQNEAIWLIHGNMFRVMMMLFFRLMAIDMTMFQFIDWFLEQFEEEEEAEKLEEDLRVMMELETEMYTAKADRRRECEKQILDMC